MEFPPARVWIEVPFALLLVIGPTIMSNAMETLWADLLECVEDGTLLPVVGQGVTTMGPDDSLVAPWLAERLALDLQLPTLTDAPSLNDIICSYLSTPHSDWPTVYKRLGRILRNCHPEPGDTLLRLASIRHLKLFLSTTIDSLLTRALDTVRHGGESLTKTYRFKPTELEDLPQSGTQQPEPVVYHLLGKASSVPDYVACEEDILDFMCLLNTHIKKLRNLYRTLGDPNLRVLFLGLNYADWEFRFFLRVLRQKRLSDLRSIDYLADGPMSTLPKSMVMFFGNIGGQVGGAVKNIKVIPCDPREFIAELADRCSKIAPPAAPVDVPATGSSLEMPKKIPTGAVFVSYAREDESAVRTLKTGLEQHGCLVWYDRERLQTGMDFNNVLEHAVRHDCSLFISVISRNTEAQHRAYFHLEREWAASTARMLPEAIRPEFYHPTVIDDTAFDAVQYEPPIFAGCHRTRLAGGNVTLEFGQRIAELQRKYRTMRES